MASGAGGGVGNVVMWSVGDDAACTAGQFNDGRALRQSAEQRPATTSCGG